MPETQHAEVLARRRSLLLCLHLEKADVPRASATDEPSAPVDGHGGEVRREADSPRVEEPSAASRDEVEDAASFLEEPPSLGEEERETIEIDLLLVRLHLREVRVDGQVQRQVAGEGIAHVDADLARGLVVGTEGQPVARRLDGRA